MSGRRWSFTLNLRGAEAPPNLWDPNTMKYLLHQTEIAPTTGTRHMQGCVIFKDVKRLTGAKALLQREDVHLEVAKAWEKLKMYCKKEETREPGAVPMEFGEDRGQGARSDLTDVAEAVKRARPWSEIASEFPTMVIKYHKGLQVLQQALHQPKQMERKAICLWGDTGVGKTRYVYNHYNNIYSVFDTKTPWFDGYRGEEVVLFDECGSGFMNYDYLKRLLDRYPMQVPVKGGSANWNAKYIYLTSNHHPRWWWEKGISEQDWAALLRRLKVFKLPDDYQELYDYTKEDFQQLQQQLQPVEPSIVEY